MSIEVYPEQYFFCRWKGGNRNPLKLSAAPYRRGMLIERFQGWTQITSIAVTSVFRCALRFHLVTEVTCLSRLAPPQPAAPLRSGPAFPCPRRFHPSISQLASRLPFSFMSRRIKWRIHPSVRPSVCLTVSVSLISRSLSTRSVCPGPTFVYAEPTNYASRPFTIRDQYIIYCISDVLFSSNWMALCSKSLNSFLVGEKWFFFQFRYNYSWPKNKM